MLKYPDTGVLLKTGGGWDEGFSGAVVLGRGCKQRSRFQRYHKLHQRTNGVKKSTKYKAHFAAKKCERAGTAPVP
jgi:hypothetical protein